MVHLTRADLTLSAGSQSQTVAMANVAAIVFTKQEDLWVTLPNGGRRRLRAMRGLSVLISAVPWSAIRLQPFNDIASVDLSSVLNGTQFAKLTNNPKGIYVLQAIEVSAEETLTLRARAHGLE